jgi:CHC2 zinc finger
MSRRFRLAYSRPRPLGRSPEKFPRLGSASLKLTLHLSRRRERRDLPKPVDFYPVVLDQLREYENGWAWARCPFHGDSNPSFCVNLESGYYKCHASHCGETGTSIVSFVSALHGLPYSDALDWLEGGSWI